MRARMHAHRYVLSFVYNYILSQHNLWEPKASKHISRAMTNQPLYSWKELTHHSMKACSHSHENSTKASRKHTSQSSSLHRPTAVWRQERSLVSATQRWTTAVWRSAPPLACGAEREREKKKKGLPRGALAIPKCGWPSASAFSPFSPFHFFNVKHDRLVTEGAYVAQKMWETSKSLCLSLFLSLPLLL